MHDFNYNWCCSRYLVDTFEMYKNFFNRRHRFSLFSLFTRINSDAEESRTRGKTNCRSVAYNTSFTIIIGQSRTLLSNFELYCISNATSIGCSGADGLSWYRIVLSNVLGTSYRANEIKDNEDESKNGKGDVRSRGGGGWKRSREGDGFLQGGTSSAT